MSRDVIPEYSAIASRPAPRSLHILAPRLSAEADRVADVGCGYMQGTHDLMQHHGRVYAVDTEFQRSRIGHRLDELKSAKAFAGFKTIEEFDRSRLRLGGAYVINVLHTLPSPIARVAVLNAVRQNLRSAGFLVIDVPYYEHYYSSRMTAENRFGDGYIFEKTPTGTRSIASRVQTRWTSGQTKLASHLTFESPTTITSYGSTVRSRS